MIYNSFGMFIIYLFVLLEYIECVNVYDAWK